MVLAQSIAESPRKFLAVRSVLIVTDSVDRETGLSDQLHQSGYNTVNSFYAGDRLKGIPRQTPDAIIIRLTTYVDQASIIADALRNRYAGRNIPLIGIFPENHEQDRTAFDSVLMDPVFPKQVVHRVAAMVRLSIMQTEMTLRLETLNEDFNIDHKLDATAFDTKLTVLFIGKATPEFMVIINALERKNVEVVAAFTSFSAFDFLHDFVFDAVVINSLNGMEPGLTIAQTMRRKSALYHTPTLLLGHKGKIQIQTAFEHGVSDILYADSDECDIQDRILELARFHRLHRQVKAEFETMGHESVLDPCGTYSSTFFSKHLNRLMDAYSAQDLPVSVLTAEVNFGDTVSLEEKAKALNELGAIIKNLVRAYDVTARISQNVFVIAFPGQAASGLTSVEGRLSTIPNNTKLLNDGPDGQPQEISLNIDIAEMGHGVTGETWLAQRLSQAS